MVVIGGIDSIAGALLGALYLVGLPAIFGTTETTEFLTSGVGLLAFILYLPGGMAQLMHRLGDAVTAMIEAARRRRSGEPEAAAHSTDQPHTSISGQGRGVGVIGKATEGAVAEAPA